MGKYTDDEIRALPKITIKIAADYLGISPMMVSLGMRNNLLPIGFAAKSDLPYKGGWLELCHHSGKTDSLQSW